MQPAAAKICGIVNILILINIIFNGMRNIEYQRNVNLRPADGQYSFRQQYYVSN